MESNFWAHTKSFTSCQQFKKNPHNKIDTKGWMSAVLNGDHHHTCLISSCPVSSCHANVVQSRSMLFDRNGSTSVAISHRMSLNKADRFIRFFLMIINYITHTQAIRFGSRGLITNKYPIYHNMKFSFLTVQNVWLSSNLSNTVKHKCLEPATLINLASITSHFSLWASFGAGVRRWCDHHTFVKNQCLEPATLTTRPVSHHTFIL